MNKALREKVLSRDGGKCIEHTNVYPKRKNIPLSRQIYPPIQPIEYTTEQYREMIEVRDLQIEDLLHAYRQIKNNKPVTALTPLLTRVIRERNELEEQRFDAINNWKRVYINPYDMV